MRHSRLIILSLFTLILVRVQAQDPERKHSIGVYQVFTDYNLSLLNNKLSSFDSSFSQSARIAYQGRLSRTWMINVGLTNGFVNNQRLNEKFTERAYVIGTDASILFKFNNGRLMKENPLIAPFLSFGYRADYVNRLKTEGEKPWMYHNQYGAGFNVRMSPRSHLQLQVAMDQKLLGDFSTNMQYRLGFTQSLGRMEDKAPIKNPKLDSDRDGIVDVIDKCPGLFGTADNKGCPDTTAFIAKKIQNDSLIELLAKQNEKIGALELQNATLRNGGSVDGKISAEREQELLKRISDIESGHKLEITKLNTELSKSKNSLSRVDTVYVKEIVYIEKGNSEVDRIAEEARIRRENEETIARLKAEKIAREEADRKAASDKVKTEPIEVPEIPIGKNYYVITISSPNLPTAEAWLKKMTVDFKDARILPQPNGYYRVGVFAARDKALADQILEQVKEIGYNPAWLSVE